MAIGRLWLPRPLDNVDQTSIRRGLGVPPGLSVVVASQKALKVFEQRKSSPASYYISWAKWSVTSVSGLLEIPRLYRLTLPCIFAGYL